MRAFSPDLRERVFRAYCQRQESIRELAQKFDVSEGFIYKLRRQDQDLGHLEPMPHGGGYPPISNKDQEALLCQWIKEKPDATLQELMNKLSKEEQVPVSRSTMSRVLCNLGLSRNKDLRCSGKEPTGTAGVLRAHPRVSGCQGHDLC